MVEARLGGLPLSRQRRPDGKVPALVHPQRLRGAPALSIYHTTVNGHSMKARQCCNGSYQQAKISVESLSQSFSRLGLEIA